MSLDQRLTDQQAAHVNAAARRFAVAHRHLTSAMLGRLGVAIGQELLILELGANEPCSQRHLAEVAGCEASTITAALRKLESAALVTRTRSTADARSQQVALTDRGRAMLHDIRSVQAAVAAKVVGAFDSAADADEFLRCLADVTTALSDAP